MINDLFSQNLWHEHIFGGRGYLDRSVRAVENERVALISWRAWGLLNMMKAALSGQQGGGWATVTLCCPWLLYKLGIPRSSSYQQTAHRAYIKCTFDVWWCIWWWSLFLIKSNRLLLDLKKERLSYISSSCSFSSINLWFAFSYFPTGYLKPFFPPLIDQFGRSLWIYIITLLLPIWNNI